MARAETVELFHYIASLDTGQRMLYLALRY